MQQFLRILRIVPLSSITALIIGLTVENLILIQPAEAGCGWLDVTCKNSGIRRTGRKIEPTNPNSDTRRILRENDPTSPAFAENQWGNAGGAGYPAAAQWMRANNGSSRGLDETQKRYLRPHFGNLLDRVAIIYNANLMDEWSYAGFRVNVRESGAQTYCNRIYVDEPYKPNDSEQLVLLAHELTHSKQCEQLGGAGRFGYHYFKEYKKAGQNYENNKLEREAFDFEKQFERELPEEIATVTTPEAPKEEDYTSCLNQDVTKAIVPCNQNPLPFYSATYDPAPYRPGTSGWTGRIGKVAFNNGTQNSVEVTLYHPDAPGAPFKSWTVQPGQNIFLANDNYGMDWGIKVNNSPVYILGRVSAWNNFNGQYIFQTGYPIWLHN